MLYDLASEPPRAGSLLESVFMLLAKRKQEQEFLKTRALIKAMLAPHVEKTDLPQAFQDYADAMFPFLHKKRSTEQSEAHKALKKWTSVGAVRVKPLWQEKKNSIVNFKSRLVKYAENVKRLEADRKSGRLRRIV